VSENYQKETGKQCLCIYKTILASNVFVPTNTKKHLNRRLRNGCFFLACWSSAPIPGEHKVFWVTLLLAVATQFCKSLIRLISLHIWVIGLSSFYFGICAGDHYGNTYVIPIHILTTRKQQLAVYETLFLPLFIG